MTPGRGEGGFEIVIISKVRDKEEQLEMEYTLIRRVMKSKRIKIYNRFKDIEENRMYGEFIKREVGNANMRIGIYRQLKELGTFSEKTKEKIRRNAIAQRSGERLKEYWFKEGLEHQLSNKVRLIDTKTGLSQVVLVSMVPSITGGSNYGVWYSMKKNTIYKGRYIIKGQEKRNKEVILEDKETGEKRVVELGEVPGITGGTRKGVWEAIKENRIYKKRYELKYVEEKKATQVLIRVVDTTDESTKEAEMKEAVELTKGTEDGIRKAIRDGRIYKKRYLLKHVEKEII